MEALETQAQATQEKENAVTKQNMKYTMSSSRGIYLSWLTGRIYSTILADHTDNKTCHVEICCIGINIHFLRPPYLISRPVCCRYVSDHKYCCHSFHLAYVQASVASPSFIVISLPSF